MRIQRIVTVERGSWRWQDAFAISTYEPRVTRAGRVVWSLVAKTGKLSMPQVRRLGYDHLPKGSLHNRPVDDSAYAT